MIGWLNGKVIYKSIGQVIIDVGGVGYEISVPTSVSETLQNNQSASLFIHHAQREDGQYLYGFVDLEQRSLFRELIKVSGIGPRTALMILSGFAVADMVSVVQRQNIDALVKIPGIGKKTAERLLFDLSGRLNKTFALDSAPAETGGSMRQALTEAESALINLGCKAAEAQKVMAQVLKKYPDEQNAEALIRAALQHYFEGIR